MIEQLDRELRAAGIPRSRRLRIVAELEDHLACDPAAQLGDPRALARQFADELGTAYARRAGFISFLTLIPMGLLFGALFALHQTANGPVVIGTQLAFVGGMLAALRAWRIRRELVVPAAQAAIVLRRTALALVGAGLTTGGLAVSSGALAHVVSGVGGAAIVVSFVSLARAARLRPVSRGPAGGDLSSDLGIDLTPWHVALLIAGAVAVCIAAAGVVQDDPFDGAARALLDGLACLGGFAALGRFLGLRPARTIR